MADLPTFLLKILMCVIPIALPKAAGVGREVPSGSSAKSWGAQGSGGQELPHTPKEPLLLLPPCLRADPASSACLLLWCQGKRVSKGSRVRYSMVLIIFLLRSCCYFVRDVLDVRSVAWQPQLDCLALVFLVCFWFVFFPKKSLLVLDLQNLFSGN